MAYFSQLILYAAATLLLFPTLAESAPNGLKCLLCTINEPHQLCNITANIEHCQDEEDTCIVRVTNFRGTFKSWKDCIKQDKCADYQGVDEDEDCKAGVVKQSCTWCCRDNNCNYDRHRYLLSTPKPIVTTTLTPPTCNVENVSKCITRFGDSADSAILDLPGKFPLFCKNMASASLCITEALSSCWGDYKEKHKKLMEKIGGELWSKCPVECNVEGGWNCTSQVLQNIGIVLAHGTGNCHDLNNEIVKYNTCLANQVTFCGTNTKEDFSTSKLLIQQELNKICPTDPVTPSTGYISNPTSRPQHEDCNIRGALTEIDELGVDILVALTNPDDRLEEICNTRLSTVDVSIKNHLHLCDDDVKENIQLYYKLVLNTVGLACDVPKPAPVCDTSAARTCFVTFWNLNDTTHDYKKTCKALSTAIQCVNYNSSACSKEENKSFLDSLSIFIKRFEDKCGDVVKPDLECNTTITLKEGGQDEIVSFQVLQNPSDLCKGKDNCHLFVDGIVEIDNEPKCSDGSPCHQVVFLQNPDDTSQSPFSIKLTNENWEDVLKFTIAASVDFIIDGTRYGYFTLKLRKVIDGEEEVRTICVYQLVILDGDRQTSTCRSINDPHITTFDGFFYHNMYHGIALLYRHLTLPYQVHALYQSCNNKKATCNCGVAIQSGDFVFIAEKCKRLETECRGRRRHKCSNVLRTSAFGHEGVTPGTRIFSRQDGMGFDVVLPHGTIVIIRKTGAKSQGFINIAIKASPYDFGQTEGICGTYDGNKKNDLKLRSGQIFTGQGSKRNQYPNGFSKQWMLHSTHGIFEGVEMNTFNPGLYCPYSSSFKTCKTSQLLQFRDFDTDGEIFLENIPHTRRPNPSQVKGHQMQIRTRREAHQVEILELTTPFIATTTSPDNEQNIGHSFLDELDIDIDYEPADTLEVAGDWTDIRARTFCEKQLLKTFSWSDYCRQIHGVDSESAIDSCIADILSTGDTEWTNDTISSMKSDCVSQLQSNYSLTQTYAGQRLKRNLLNAVCPEQCNNFGICNLGKCECDAEHVGYDCSLHIHAIPRDIHVRDDGFCNPRLSNCSVIQVYGNDFIDSQALTCHIVKIVVDDNGVTPEKPQFQNIPAVFISRTQVLCVLPELHSHYVDISNDGGSPSGFPALFIPVDPVCYRCFLADELTETSCVRKEESCVIDGECYGDGELHVDDECKICNPYKSTVDWQRNNHKLNCKNIIGVMGAVIILILIIVIVIVIVVLWKKRAKLFPNCCGRNQSKARPHSALYQQAPVHGTPPPKPKRLKDLDQSTNFRNPIYTSV